MKVWRYLSRPFDSFGRNEDFQYGTTTNARTDPAITWDLVKCGSYSHMPHQQTIVMTDRRFLLPPVQAAVYTSIVICFFA
jgi:hypothetical protein